MKQQIRSQIRHNLNEASAGGGMKFVVTQCSIENQNEGVRTKEEEEEEENDDDEDRKFRP